MKTNRAWIAAIITILMGVVFSASNNQVTPAQTTIMKYFNIGNGLAGSLVTATTVISIFLALPGGGLCAKYGAKKLGILSIICCLSGNVLGILSNSFELLMIGQALQGIGFAMSGIIGPAIISELFPADRRGLPMGLWSCYVGLGTMCIMNVANLVLNMEDPSSWKQVWMMTCAALAIVLVLFCLFVKLPEKERNSQAENEKEKISSLQGLKNIRVWLLAIIMFAYSFGVCVTAVFMSNYCQTKLGVPLAEANTVVSVFSLGMIVGGVASGALLNRCQKYYHLLVLASIVATAAFSIVFLCPESLLVPVLALCGIGVALVPPILFSLGSAESATPQLTGVTMGVIAFGNSFATIGTTIQGFVIDTGGWSMAAVVQCAVGIVCIIASGILFMGKTEI